MKRVFIIFIYCSILLIDASFAELKQVHFKTKHIKGHNLEDVTHREEKHEEETNEKMQTREGGYLLSGGVSALGALLFIKIKAVLFVIAIVLIIGLITKVVGGYGLMCGIGGPCDGPFASTAHGSSSPYHPSYKDSDSYFPNYNPGHGDEYYKRAMNTFDLEFLAKIMKSVDFVDMTFNAMNLEDEECRKKMVCQVDNSAVHSPVIAYLIDSFKGNLDKYRTIQNLNATVQQDCELIYPACKRTLNPMNLNFFEQT